MINPNTPFLSTNGTVSREWLNFFYALANAVGGVNDHPDLTSLLSTMDENFSATIEIEKAVDAVRSTMAVTDAVWPRLAELGKALDALGNNQADGQTALIAEAQKTVAELQTQLIVQQDGNARLAEIEKRLNDLEIGNLFATPGLLLDYIPWTPFTPSLAGQTTAGNNTYSNRAGYYMKLGRTVFVKVTITLSAKDAAMAGDVILTGLPFTSANDNARASGTISVLDSVSLNSGYTGLGVGMLPNTDYLRFIQWNASGTSAYLTAANLTNTSWFDLSITFNI